MKISPRLAAPPPLMHPGIRPAPSIAAPWRVMRDDLGLIGLVTGACLLAGLGYALLAPQVYEANIAIQVEDDERPPGNFLDAAATNALSVKTPATGETEILKSRMILTQAIENTRLFIDARPDYPPVVGTWIAAHAGPFSMPGFLGFLGIGAQVTGKEAIEVAQFDVPAEQEGSRFMLVAGRDGDYTLAHPSLPVAVRGRVGEPLVVPNRSGSVRLLVMDLQGAPGARFALKRNSVQNTVNTLQAGLRVIEKGKQSGMLDVSWQSSDRLRLAEVLNEIGRLYVRQNVDRKTAEAEKTLGFLNTELPKFKQQLEQSEEYYNQYRNLNGTISLDDEARMALAQSVDLQAKLFDARQRRLDLVGRFTDEHPSVLTLDTQIAALVRAIGVVEGRIRRMPQVQQSTLRMQRDIKVNTDMYSALLNSSLQMRLAKEGKIGNVRLIDEAVVPEQAIRPNRRIAMAFALLAGLFLGAMAALARHRIGGRVGSAAEIEGNAGLNVFSTVPASPAQRAMGRAIARGQPGVHVLAMAQPEDAAIESLRRLRNTLKFEMQHAPDKRVLITSATAGAGKTFVAVNLAAVLACSGKRVMLIDADMQAQGVCDYLSLSQAASVPRPEAASQIGHALHTEVLPNLDVLTAARASHEPGELLSSDAFTRLLAQLSDRYDAVVIDAPPMLSHSAAAAIAPYASTVLLVAAARETPLAEINECVIRLSHVGCAFNGVVLNRVRPDRHQRSVHRLGRKAPGLALLRS